MRKSDFIWYKANTEVHLYATCRPVAHDTKNTYIYLTNNYLNTQSTKITYSFFLFRPGKKDPIALFRLNPSSCNIWHSPFKAPFGGIQSFDNCREDEAIFLLKCVEKIIKMMGGKKIIIKTHPENYDIPAHKRLFACYKLAGYRLKEIFRNHIITVTNHSFSNMIRVAENRRLKKCHKAEFIVTVMENPNIVMVYDFIKVNRDRLGYSLSLTFHELKNLAEIFPDEIKVFSVSDHDKLIALAVTVRVNKNILYNFLPADVPEYRQYSPMVLLMDGIYRYCQEQKISTIDLGVSLDHLGKEKPSLIRFKENIGGKECQKITWEKDLDTQTVIGAIEDSGTRFMSNDGQHTTEINTFEPS